MDPQIDPEVDRLPENSWVRAWEDQLLDEYTSERDTLDQQSKLEQEATAQRLWLSFQSSASAVTNLYKDCLQEQNCWFPFQNAAGAVTDLYKDAMDTQKKSLELGIQLGYNKRVRDIITWVKRRRRNIRRDELLAYLCGKTPPRSQRHSPPRSRVGSRSHSERGSPMSSGSHVAERDTEPDLTAFQNALAIQGLNGAMSNVSMGYNSSSAQTRSDELNCFIMDGLTRHNESRKRSMPNLDVNMDTPSKKRYRNG